MYHAIRIWSCFVTLEGMVLASYAILDRLLSASLDFWNKYVSQVLYPLSSATRAGLLLS